LYVSADRFGTEFVGKLKDAHPGSSVRLVGAEIVDPFVDFSTVGSADVSTGLYAIALPTARPL
jgi:hypothetical protein